MDQFTKNHLRKWLEFNIPTNLVDIAYIRMCDYVKNNDIAIEDINWSKIANQCEVFVNS